MKGCVGLGRDRDIVGFETTLGVVSPISTPDVIRRAIWSAVIPVFRDAEIEFEFCLAGTAGVEGAGDGDEIGLRMIGPLGLDELRDEV